jgi:hypothetical protein
LKTRTPEQGRRRNAADYLVPPLKAGVIELREKLEAFLASIRQDDQVILGLDPIPRIAQFASSRIGARGPSGDRRLRSGTAANPKISKLAQMARVARHENWVVVDSEVLMDRGFAEAFRNEWAVSGAHVLTAGYRITGTDTAPQRLDAMSVLLTLWPGLELVRMFGTVRFTLGACTAIRRNDLAELGDGPHLATTWPRITNSAND